MSSIGIDLGTSNSAAAVYRRGRVESLQIDGRSIMPSCIAAKPGGGLLVGELAKRRALIDPMNSIVAVKREMGNRDYRATIGDREYTPVEISALILQKLAAGASEQLGEPIKDVVISVPAYFNNNQKEDTRLAGEKAGLNVLRLIPEPTAAAIAYGLDKGRDQTILVYDLGGGTFDVSILQVRGNNFEVIGIGGAHELGGEDFDRRLIDLIIAELRHDSGLTAQLADLDAGRIGQQLKESAEAAKKELSSAETVEIEIPDLAAGSSFHLKVSRQQYDDAIRDLVVRSIDITMDTLREAGLSADDVDRVVLVGGSTRVPLIQQTIAERICDPYIADNVDEVVAHGAAIMAASLSSIAEGDLAPIEVTNITAHSLGIRANEDRFAEIIPRGTRLPSEACKVFTTARDNADRTDVVIFQGQEEYCSDNDQIGGFGLTGIERAPAGKPQIEVHFSLDLDDILNVTARDLSTGRTGQIKIEKFEPKPYEPADQETPSLESLRIGVSPSGCDDAGAILRRLGLNYKKLGNSDFRQSQLLNQFDVLFINCLCDPTQILGEGLLCSPTKNAAALREFVSQGGVLYVSDYAYGNVARVFPGKITFGGKKGGAGRHTVQIVDSQIQHLTGTSATVEFGPGYVVATTVKDGCNVYIKKGTEPVLISFPYDDGHVVYTSFHNAAGIDDNIARVVGYVILQTIALATSTPLVELAESADLRRRK